MGERYAEKGSGAARTTLITKTGVTMHTMHSLIAISQGDIAICMFRLQVLTSHKVFEETAWNVYIAFMKCARVWMLAPVVRERAEHTVSCRAKLQVPSVCQRIGALKFAFDACMLWFSRCDAGRHYISGRLQTM
jgi:hypothetical protein